MNSKQKLQLLSADVGEKNLVLLKEEIERSGQMKVETMKMKQTIKEQESLEGMLNAKTKELAQVKKQLSLVRHIAVPSTSGITNRSRLESIQKTVIEATK